MDVLFFAIGVGLGVFFVYLWARFTRESITIANGKISWIGGDGQCRVDCSTNDVLAGRFYLRVLIPLLSENSSPAYFYSVDTKNGTIKWDQNISDLKALNHAVELLANQPTGPKKP
ncbi:MAG TPA: hypothetical protein VGL56_09565 [Fimbriimonadaceae bacterium]